MNYECNIFKNVWDSDCSNVVRIESILKGIKNGRWESRVTPVREAKAKGDQKLVDKLKERLPAVTFCGVFDGTREDENCVVYNYLMIIDIDSISGTRLSLLKKELVNNPMVYAFFDGPSKGIKVLMFIDSELEWHNTHAFAHVEKLFMDMYGVNIDPSGKNPSRLCFVSYDPNLYINPNPQALHIEKQKGSALASFHSIKKHDFKNSVPETDGRKIIKLAVKMVTKSKVGSYHVGNRNNFIFSLACLLCEFGLDPDQVLSDLALRYKSLDHKEIKNTIESAYKRNKHKFGTKVLNKKTNKDQTNLI